MVTNFTVIQCWVSGSLCFLKQREHKFTFTSDVYFTRHLYLSEAKKTWVNFVKLLKQHIQIKSTCWLIEIPAEDKTSPHLDGIPSKRAFKRKNDNRKRGQLKGLPLDLFQHSTQKSKFVSLSHISVTTTTKWLCRAHAGCIPAPTMSFSSTGYTLTVRVAPHMGIFCSVLP